MKAQSEFIQATIDEIFQLVNVFKLNDLVKDFSKIVKSNFSLNEMLTYAPYVFSIERDKIKTYQLQGEAKYIGGGSYFVADDDANEELIEKYFTPSSETVSRNELEIQQTVIGVSSETVDIGNIKMSNSFLNRFTSVDIIDASGGKADASAVKDELKKYGFNVKNISETEDAVNIDSTVVSKFKNNRAASVAAICGCSNYVYNKSKNTGSDVTVIIGKDSESD